MDGILEYLKKESPLIRWSVYRGFLGDVNIIGRVTVEGVEFAGEVAIRDLLCLCPDTAVAYARDQIIYRITRDIKEYKGGSMDCSLCGEPIRIGNYKLFDGKATCNACIKKRTCHYCGKKVAPGGNYFGGYPACRKCYAEKMAEYIVKGDVVNHPDHYNWHPKAECIDIIQEFVYNIGAAMKHLWRAGRKDGNTRLQDLKKAKMYIEFEIEREERNDKDSV